jgi:hypothetical protein
MIICGYQWNCTSHKNISAEDITMPDLTETSPEDDYRLRTQGSRDRPVSLDVCSPTAASSKTFIKRRRSISKSAMAVALKPQVPPTRRQIYWPIYAAWSYCHHDLPTDQIGCSKERFELLDDVTPQAAVSGRS